MNLPRTRAGVIAAISACLLAAPCFAQVFTVEREHVSPHTATLAVVQPTSVSLEQTPLTHRTREQLIRAFQSEQGFAVRPLPLGHRGLVLHANGPLSPSGNAYIDVLEKKGISARPGDRLVISKFEIRPDRIVIDFNGGPDKHHRILQHISIGGMGGEVPLAQDDGVIPAGSRLTLVFPKYVPEMTPAELRALLEPVLDFSRKTPTQAYADTLPPLLKNAILTHHVLVGMNKRMVLAAKGEPGEKMREMDGQMPIEIWIYGKAPEEVQFVRFNGNRSIRLEIADVGKPIIVHDQDETGGYFEGQFVHQVRLGDASPAAPGQDQPQRPAPTLRNPGEQPPGIVDPEHQMKPVQFPKNTTEPAPIPPPPNQNPN